MASLSSYKNNRGNLSWTASSNRVRGVTFTPPNGVLAPGQTTRVTITIPNMICPAQADLIFKGPGNMTDILWNCGASAWSFSPRNFKAETDCRYRANAGWTCNGTLAEDFWFRRQCEMVCIRSRITWNTCESIRRCPIAKPTSPDSRVCSEHAMSSQCSPHILGIRGNAYRCTMAMREATGTDGQSNQSLCEHRL